MIVVGALVLGAAYILIKPKLKAMLSTSAVFTKTQGAKNNVTIHLNGQPVNMLSDTGSDLTLLTYQDGVRLGLVGKQCDPLPVSGISDIAEEFCKVPVTMKIQDMAAFNTFVGVGGPKNPLRDNLLGSKDLDRFHVTFSPNQIKFSQAHTKCDSGVCMLPLAG